MPNSKKTVSNSFSESSGRRAGPQDSERDEAGYLGIRKIFADDAARKAAEKERRALRRSQRMRRKQNQRAYAKAKARAVVKPTAVEQAASLA